MTLASPAGRLDARGRHVAMVAARFNAPIVDAGRRCDRGVDEHGGDPARCCWCARRAPSNCRWPRKLAASGRYDAVVALGCVIRGDTAHFDFVAGEGARGLIDEARAPACP